METNILKYLAFTKTIEYGSFTKASEVLNYSQSGISRMIRDLEEEWGITLLERKHSGVKLTSEGAAILPDVISLCNEFQNLQSRIDALHGIQSGMIRIGTFSSIASNWLPNIIKAFQKDYPNVDFEFRLGYYDEIESWINEGSVDCGFLKLPVNSDLEITEMKEDRLLAVVPKDHPLAKSKKIPLKSLCEEPFMLLEKEEKAEISEIFDRNGLKPRTHFITCDDYSVMSMVESGLGVSILPELILRRIPYDIAARELDVPAYRTIVFAVRSRKNASAAVKKFMEYLDYRE